MLKLFRLTEVELNLSKNIYQQKLSRFNNKLFNGKNSNISTFILNRNP